MNCRLIGKVWDTRSVFVDGYIRVSDTAGRHGERFISPVEQREAIERWAVQRGFHLMEVYEELDDSGARADRPLLERAVTRIEAGVSNGLVVTHVDRFGRSLLDGLQAIERIRARNGEFYAVADGLDTSTDAGRLVCQILLSTAEYQLARVRAGWDTSRRHAIRRGVWMGNTTPVGYRKTRSGRLRAAIGTPARLATLAAIWSISPRRMARSPAKAAGTFAGRATGG